MPFLTAIRCCLRVIGLDRRSQHRHMPFHSRRQRVSLSIQSLEPRFAMSVTPLSPAAVIPALPVQGASAGPLDAASILVAEPSTRGSIGASGAPSVRGVAGITSPGIADATIGGYGGMIGPDDPYYPGSFNNDVVASGLTGAAYLVLDKALNQGLGSVGAVNYFFEAGGLFASGSIAPSKASLIAAAYAGTNRIFGLGTISQQQAADAVDRHADVGRAIRSLTNGLATTRQQRAAVTKLVQTTRLLQGVGHVLALARELPPRTVKLHLPGVPRLNVTLRLDDQGATSVQLLLRPGQVPRLQARFPNGTTLSGAWPRPGFAAGL